ncbi:DsbA family protein [Candidatus Nanosalina sp. VS9-1]|uniref:DsbA family protein n=1 Tax=Candidatus Nanosalina sp. VS9-1 TaxID=3388566 RepID=UPI0039DF8E55
MPECDFCGEEFESDLELHVHWGEEHEDELNSHQKDTVKKARREKEEQEKKESERKKNLAFKVLASGVAIVIAAILIPQLLNAGNGGDASNSTASFTLEGEPVLGNESANVSIVAFEDFYCPSCKSFNDGVKPRLEDNYIETGQAKFYYLDFPLDFHDPQATAASVAAECTYQQDEESFWPVHDALYDVQRSIDYTPERLTQLVEENTEGLDYEAIQSCIASQETVNRVNEDMREGLNAGVSGTPTIFVNGEQASDFRYSTLESMIEDELAG